jgi:chloramphenicol O-acetyltransferase type A
MTFRPIDMDAYPRREHFEHFLAMHLTYSATVSIDVTHLRATAKERGFRLYPAQIWMLSTVANRVPEFRMSRDNDGNLGVWDRLDPLYTAMSEPTTPFSGICTPYHREFGGFYSRCRADIETNAHGAFMPQGAEPPNALNISSIPWVAFTGFNLNLSTDYLLPILTIGRHAEQDGVTRMPRAMQAHHAVCDGYHLGRFVEEVQALADSSSDWLKS